MFLGSTTGITTTTTSTTTTTTPMTTKTTTTIFLGCNSIEINLVKNPTNYYAEIENYNVP